MSQLAARLTPATLRPLIAAQMAQDAAHDWFHIERVFHNGLAIAATEDGVEEVVLRAALLLHDLGEKQPQGGNAPVRPDTIAGILRPLGVPEASIPPILTAINEHSYSQGRRPRSLESAILQDADRLDAIGAIGIARAFAFGGARGRPLYDPDDPSSTVHHFHDKLLRLKDGMHTAEGRRLAERRHQHMQDFLAQFDAEWHGVT